jgi:TetR/AcrR family transcriptional regulator, transcriptional repressor for nem operon
MPRNTNKKDKLLKAADELFLQKGIILTTLADIANLADVPLGNVYYYFKTKGSIISNVIKQRCNSLEMLLDQIEQTYTKPTEQIKALIHLFLNINQTEKQTVGVLITVLWQELNKEHNDLLDEFLKLPNLIIDWCTKRLKALEKNDANEYAVGLLSAMQGLLVMSNEPKMKKQLPAQAKFIESSFGLSNQG